LAISIGPKSLRVEAMVVVITELNSFQRLKNVFGNLSLIVKHSSLSLVLTPTKAGEPECKMRASSLALVLAPLEGAMGEDVSSCRIQVFGSC